MKLYFNPRSRAVITKWLLDELGAEYELVHIDYAASEHRTPEFLAINPAGKLPALVDGDAKVFESVAIALYLADRFPEAGLAPAADDPARGRYLSYMVFATSQLEPAVGDHLTDTPLHRQRGWVALDRALALLDEQVGDGPFLLGEQFSAADVLIGAQLLWAGVELPPNLTAYVARLKERPHAPRVG